MQYREIGFYWSGSKMSWLRYMTLYSFRKYNPEWKINVFYDNFGSKQTWNTADNNYQDFTEYRGSDFVEHLKKLAVNYIEWIPENKDFNFENVAPSQRSNFFKWELLSKGGMYCDLDILFIEPIDKVEDAIATHDCGLTYDKYYSIGFMFSHGIGRKMFFGILENAYKTFDRNQYQGAGVMTLYKKWPDVNSLVKSFPGVKFFNVPMEWFYYNDSEKKEKIFIENNYSEVKKVSMGIHWYAGCRFTQDKNNEINEETYKNYNNTLCAALKEILND